MSQSFYFGLGTAHGRQNKQRYLAFIRHISVRHWLLPFVNERVRLPRECTSIEFLGQLHSQALSGHVNGHSRWNGIVSAPTQFSPILRLLHSAPLFKKERHITLCALVPD